MKNPFKKQQNAQELINQVKQEVEGGVEMRNDKEQPVETPTVQEREINLTLLNDKLNYVMSLCNKIAEKSGIDLEE